MRQSGFTLIELLVVITIVSILSAIAIPQFHEYRARAFDVRAQEDLRSIALAEEAYFFDTEHYLSCDTSSCAELPGIARISNGVRVSVTADDTQFEGESYDSRGSGKHFRWSSERGGFY